MKKILGLLLVSLITHVSIADSELKNSVKTLWNDTKKVTKETAKKVKRTGKKIKDDIKEEVKN